MTITVKRTISIGDRSQAVSASLEAAESIYDPGDPSGMSLVRLVDHLISGLPTIATASPPPVQ